VELPMEVVIGGLPAASNIVIQVAYVSSLCCRYHGAVGAD
jgi:hypothetical protein